MNQEDKLYRNKIRQISRIKDHAKRRHLGRKKQLIEGGTDLADFHKKFPQLLTYVWPGCRLVDVWPGCRFIDKDYDKDCD